MNTTKKVSEFSVNLQQMVVAIESSVSLVGMNDTNHGKRVGYIALQIASHLAFCEVEKSFVFELGLLHDCGVSSDTVHTNLVNQFDWEEAHKHSDIGYNLMKEFEPLAQLAIPIRYHHTRWDELKNINIPQNEKRLANLIFIADRVDVSASSFYGRDILLHADNIRESIKKKKGTFFDPELVNGFLAASRPESFWISLEDRHITRFTWDMGNRGYEKKLKLDDLKQLAKIFSYLVDQKSSFTAQHSFRVAQLARHLAIRCVLPSQDIDKIEVAGYLHDIGKLHVPDCILNKPGPLTKPERSIINQHSYETYEILRTINGLEEIAKWAAYHHENSQGTGYPFHPSESDFSVPARIIAVADVFQALVQDRPYRKGMTFNEVFKILYDLRKEGKLDETIVQVATEDAEQCYKVARGES